ncbi:MAG TPA: hypothetical protein VNF68_06645, partial [Candidatus Baltobacteraceae bacterium]|nr:hypothetical protein [Candidatus Baltobacteraceae bacterium]
TLFPVRPAYLLAEDAPVNTFTKPLVPINEFVGENPPYGALISYDLRSAAKRVTIDVLDASGRVIRHLDSKDVPKTQGIDRTSWDLAEDAPVKWYGTYKDNQGPDKGADVMPGTYTVRIAADGRSAQAQLVVKADPRDPRTAEQARTRYAFLTQVLGELSGVDGMLNHIDAKLAHAASAQRVRLLAFQAKLTYNPQSVEDLRGPASLREDLVDLLNRVEGTSFQTPTQPDLQYAAQLKSEYDALEAQSKEI